MAWGGTTVEEAQKSLEMLAKVYNSSQDKGGNPMETKDSGQGRDFESVEKEAEPDYEKMYREKCAELEWKSKTLPDYEKMYRRKCDELQTEIMRVEKLKWENKALIKAIITLAENME